jgi:hypothetical protein
VLLMLFAAEFASGFGVMVLDIAIGAIFAAIIPDTMRSSRERSRRSATSATCRMVTRAVVHCRIC